MGDETKIVDAGGCRGWYFARLVAAVFLLGPPLAAAAAEGFTGRRVQDVLHDLQAQSFNFIYSDALVPEGLTVLREPNASGGLRLAADILAQHGLDLARAGPGVYAVVRGRSAIRTDTAAPFKAPQDSTTLEEVVVSTSRYPLGSGGPVTSTVLSQQEVDILPRLGDETLRSVHRLPGAASNGLSGPAAIRGGDPHETLILLDGVPLVEPFHLKNFLSPVSLLDARMIDSLEVYTGGFPAQYGTRMSAVIDARSLRPRADRYLELGASLFHTNGLAAQRFADGGQWLISARRSNLGDLARVLKSEYGEPEYFDVFGRVEYPLSEATRLTGSYLGSRDEIDARRESRMERSAAKYRNNYGWVTLDHAWSERFSGRLIGSLTDVVNRRSGSIEQVGQRVGQLSDERTYHVAGLQADFTYQAPRAMHRWGATARRLSARYDYASSVQLEAGFPFPDSPRFEAQRSAAPRPTGEEYSAYWASRFEIARPLVAELGARWDDETYTDTSGGTQLAPRLGLMYTLPGGQRLRASWGRYFQAQAINELEIEDGVAEFFPAQRATQLVVSFETDLWDSVQLRIEGYRKKYSSLGPRFENLFQPLVMLPELEPDRVRIDPERAKAEGIEILLARRTGVPWNWWLAYTGSRTNDVQDGRSIPRSWDQRHAVSAGIQWSDGRWDITLADTYHSGWPTTPITLDSAGPSVIVGARNSARFGAFNSLDLRASRRFVLSRGELDVFAEVTNLINQRNPCCVDYVVTEGSDGNRALERDVSHWLGIVPSAGVLWRY